MGGVSYFERDRQRNIHLKKSNVGYSNDFQMSESHGFVTSHKRNDFLRIGNSRNYFHRLSRLRVAYPVKINSIHDIPMTWRGRTHGNVMEEIRLSYPARRIFIEKDVVTGILQFSGKLWDAHYSRITKTNHELIHLSCVDRYNFFFPQGPERSNDNDTIFIKKKTFIGMNSKNWYFAFSNQDVQQRWFSLRFRIHAIIKKTDGTISVRFFLTALGSNHQLYAKRIRQWLRRFTTRRHEYLELPVFYFLQEPRKTLKDYVINLRFQSAHRIFN